MPETIRAAPPEVRRWLQREVAAALGLPMEGAPAPEPSKHLVACSPQEAAAVYEAIRGVLPAVSVFFELGRAGEPVGQNGVEAHSIADMLRHTRIQGMEQIAACLRVIDDAVRRVRGDAAATLCAIDRRGYCVIAAETRRSIAEVWQQLLAAQPTDEPMPSPGEDAPRVELDNPPNEFPGGPH